MGRRSALRRTVMHPKSGGSNPIKTAFYAIFNAFFDFCVRQEKSPERPQDILESIKGLNERLYTKGGRIKSNRRVQNIKITKGLIEEYFVHGEPPAIQHSAGTALSFENALRRSRVETAAYECKQGLLKLNTTRGESEGLLARIVQTICGIANIGPDSEGAIFIGVADNEGDKKRIESMDNMTAFQIGARFCVGVDRELSFLNLDLEAYKRKIVSHIANSGLSNPLKSAVLSKLDCITYRGHSVVCIWIPSQDSPSDVNDVMYVREGSSTVAATGRAKSQAVYECFAKQS